MDEHATEAELLGPYWHRDPVFPIVGPYCADMPWNPVTRDFLKHMAGRARQTTVDGTLLPVCVWCSRAARTAHVNEKGGVYCSDECATLHSIDQTMKKA